jgi:hypothetical protein
MTTFLSVDGIIKGIVDDAGKQRCDIVGCHIVTLLLFAARLAKDYGCEKQTADMLLDSAATHLIPVCAAGPLIPEVTNLASEAAREKFAQALLTGKCFYELHATVLLEQFSEVVGRRLNKEELDRIIAACKDGRGVVREYKKRFGLS